MPLSQGQVEDVFASFGDESHISGSPQVLPSPSAPIAVARQFVEHCCLHNGAPNALTLRYWHGGWWTWRITHWAEAEERTVRALLYAFTEVATYLDGKTFKPWLPTRRKIGDMLEALAALVILSDDFEQPCWINGHGVGGPIVAVCNGLLDVASRTLHSHSPLYFNQTSVPFDYDPLMPAPAKWLAFLDELWPQESEASNLLGEWFGYVVSGRLDLHKILLMWGRRAVEKALSPASFPHLSASAMCAGRHLTAWAAISGLRR